MRLNLHILAADLDDLDIHASLADPYDVRPISFASFAEPAGSLQPDRLYVLDASLARTALSTTVERANVLFTGGPPPECALEGKRHNIAWTSKAISRSGLIDRINERFAFYDDWMEQTETSFALNLPLRRIVEQTIPLFDCPIWMWDAQFQTVFHVMPQNGCPLPSTYQMHEDGKPWPTSEINAVNDDFRRALRSRKPVVLPAMFGYNSLIYNIFDGGVYVATLAVDGVGGKQFGKRDQVLLKYFGERLSESLKYEAHFSKHATYDANEHIEHLLRGAAVPNSQLAASLSKMGWSIDDTYYCIATQHVEGNSYPDVAMIPCAQAACSKSPATTFSVIDGSIVFVVNHTLGGTRPDEVCGGISFLLESHGMHMHLGVSTPFTSFADLPYFHKQACEAISLHMRASDDADCPTNSRVSDFASPHKARAKTPASSSASTKTGRSVEDKPAPPTVCYFHDHILDAMAERCLADTIPEALYPPSLLRLIRYDRTHGSDLVNTLRVYLDHDASTNKTAAALYMHRNTLLARLNKIEQVGQVDLTDGQTRLLLSMSFVIMKRAKAH